MSLARRVGTELSDYAALVAVWALVGLPAGVLVQSLLAATGSTLPVNSTETVLLAATAVAVALEVTGRRPALGSSVAFTLLYLFAQVPALVVAQVAAYGTLPYAVVQYGIPVCAAYLVAFRWGVRAMASRAGELLGRVLKQPGYRDK